MKILIFAAHLDDAILGAGGTILNHLKNGDEVRLFVFAGAIGGKEGLQEIKKAGVDVIFGKSDEIELNTKTILGLVGVIRESKPDIVLTHIPEGHIDHIKTSISVIRAAELAFSDSIKSNNPPHKVKRIYLFETIESTLANSGNQCNVVFINTDKDHVR